MKKFIALAISAFLLSSCNEKPGYEISGTVSNKDLNGNYVYLYLYGSNTTPLDSILVENNSFTFKGTQEKPLLSILRFGENVTESQRVQTGELLPYTAIFVLDNNKFNIKLDQSSSATGNPETDTYYAFLTDLKNLRSSSEKIYSDMRSDDAETLAKAEDQYEQMESAVTTKVKGYINSNPDKQTAAKVLYDFRHSLDEDERREIISKAGDSFKAVPGIDKMIDHLNTLEKVAIGKEFTDFEMNGLDGKMHKLSEYVGNGKIVLIDFWASWCPPCRADMPHLVNLYNQYKNKNFEIVGVSLDRTDDAWKKGLKDLHMTWPQLSDLKYWQNEGAALYGVNSIPHTVLVDAKGTIIAKNLRGEALDEKLKELLN